MKLQNLICRIIPVFFSIGVTSTDIYADMHESQDYINYHSLLYEICTGNYKGEVVLPTDIFLSWIHKDAFQKESWTKASSIYIPATCTYDKTRHGITSLLYYDRPSRDQWSSFLECLDGSFNFIPNVNLKTAIYESPNPALEDFIFSFWGEGVYDCKEEHQLVKSKFHTNPFKGCSSLVSVEILDLSCSLRSDAGVLFLDNDLVTFPGGRHGKYVIPEGTVRIRYDAFFDATGLTSLTIPVSLDFIDKNNEFANCTNLNTVTVSWDTPVAFCFDLFSEETYKTARLIVPQGTISDYATVSPWCNFSNIYDSAGIDSPIVDDEKLSCDVFTTLGVCVKSAVEVCDWQNGLNPGIYILRMSDGSTLKRIVK